MKKIRLFILLTALFFCPSFLWAAGRTFVPKIAGYSGDMEIEAVYERDTNSSKETGYQTSDTGFREQLKLKFIGYVYHPRFVIFGLDTSLGLEEANYSEDGEGSWQTATADEYRLWTMLLPKHPYNLELYTSRYQPLLEARLIGNRGQVREESGAYLRYKRIPWAGSLGYVVENTSGGGDSSDSGIYRMDLSYFSRPGKDGKRLLQASGSFQHTDTSFSDGLLTVQDQLYLESRVSWWMFSLFSEWKSDSEDKDEPDSEYSYVDRIMWTERLDIDLPWNFSSQVFYRQDTDDSDTGDLVREQFVDPNHVTRNRDILTPLVLFDDSKSLTWLLHHRLFESLDSAFEISDFKTDSSGGRTEQDNYRFNMNYNKQFRLFRVLTGLFGGESGTAQSGAPTVLNEVHNAVLADPVRNSFTLDNREIDPASIQVSVRDPDTHELVDLDEGLNYFISSRGNSVEIEIFSLPPDEFEPDREYEYLVTYTFVQGKFKLNTVSSGYHFRIFLFDNVVSPYYSHNSSEQTLEEGEFPGELDTSTGDTYGLSVQQDPFTVNFEYERVESNINPEKDLTIQLDYRRLLARNTNFYITLRGEKDEYLETVGREAATLENWVIENSLTSNMEVHYRMPDRNLTCYVTGNYQRRKGVTDSTMYSLNSYLTWHYGKAEITLQAGYTDFTSYLDDDFSNKSTTEIDLTIKRKLF